VRELHAQNLKELLERIHLRLDESMVGIGAEVVQLSEDGAESPEDKS
jgi:hypothetical protein